MKKIFFLMFVLLASLDVNAMMIDSDDDLVEYNGNIHLTDEDREQVKTLVEKVYDMPIASYEILETAVTDTPVLLLCFEDKKIADNSYEKASLIVNNKKWIKSWKYKLKKEHRLKKWVVSSENLDRKKYYTFNINQKDIELNFSTKLSYKLVEEILFAIDSDKIINKEKLDDGMLSVDKIDYIGRNDNEYTISIGTCFYNSYLIDFNYDNGHLVILSAGELMIS